MNQQIEAAIELAVYQLFRKHRIDGLSPNMANRALMLQYLEENVLAPSFENMDAAYLHLKGSLVHQDRPASVTAPATSEREAPSPVLTERQRLKAMSKEELRLEVKKQRRYQDLPELPAIYTSATLQSLAPSALLQLMKKYSSEQVNRRLNEVTA